MGPVALDSEHTHFMVSETEEKTATDEHERRNAHRGQSTGVELCMLNRPSHARDLGYRN